APSLGLGMEQRSMPRRWSPNYSRSERMTSQGDPNPARRAYRDLDQLEQTTTDPGRRPRRKWGVRVTDPASNSRVSEPGGGSARCSQSCLSSQRQSRYGTI